MMTEQEFIDKATPLFKSIYRRHSAGCCLHVIIDDGNWDCVYDPDSPDIKHDDCRALAAILQEIPLENKWRLTVRHNPLVLRFVEEDEDEDWT